ncbi:hypothetical protein CGZ93_03670 [Enemella dayhoffiae]|uniref:Uncharacterized protein n=1 Tax=Enemella dayhoffiae TaxID=2016507 RepID=A0A255HA81_9ACTN|nr:hypothetical protein CGZ93_03670 [Enemella dayhoffiae]
MLLVIANGPGGPSERDGPTEALALGSGVDDGVVDCVGWVGWGAAVGVSAEVPTGCTAGDGGAVGAVVVALTLALGSGVRAVRWVGVALAVGVAAGVRTGADAGAGSVGVPGPVAGVCTPDSLTGAPTTASLLRPGSRTRASAVRAMA